MLISIASTSLADKALVQKCPAPQGQNVAPYEAKINAIVARLYSLMAKFVTVCLTQKPIF
ncbi:hypothetical protein [Trichothermofontia sp.]